MSCCGCVPTPDSILEDDDVDVFEQIIPESETYHTEMRQILWDFYGLRGIGNCDMAYWIKAMQARFRQIRTVYNIKFRLVDEWLSTMNESIDLSDHAEESTTTNAHGHVITNAYGRRVNTLDAGSRTDTSEHEDNPDNPAGTTKYLASRDTNTVGGQTDTSTDDAVTDTSTNSGTDTITWNNKTYSGLSSETVGRFLETIPDLQRQFADEFKLQFYHGV